MRLGEKIYYKFGDIVIVFKLKFSYLSISNKRISLGKYVKGLYRVLQFATNKAFKLNVCPVPLCSLYRETAHKFTSNNVSEINSNF